MFWVTHVIFHVCLLFFKILKCASLLVLTHFKIIQVFYWDLWVMTCCYILLYPLKLQLLPSCHQILDRHASIIRSIVNGQVKRFTTTDLVLLALLSGLGISEMWPIHTASPGLTSRYIKANVGTVNSYSFNAYYVILIGIWSIEASSIVQAPIALEWFIRATPCVNPPL